MRTSLVCFVFRCVNILCSSCGDDVVRVEQPAKECDNHAAESTSARINEETSQREFDNDIWLFPWEDTAFDHCGSISCKLVKPIATGVIDELNEASLYEKRYTDLDNCNESRKKIQQVTTNGENNDQNRQVCNNKRKIATEEYKQTSTNDSELQFKDEPSCSRIKYSTKRQPIDREPKFDVTVNNQCQVSSKEKSTCSNPKNESIKCVFSHESYSVPLIGNFLTEIEIPINSSCDLNNICTLTQTTITLSNFEFFCKSNMHFYLPFRRWKDSRDAANLTRALNLNHKSSNDLLSVIGCLFNVPNSSSCGSITYALQNMAKKSDFLLKCTRQLVANTIPVFINGETNLTLKLLHGDYFKEVKEAYAKCVRHIDDTIDALSIIGAYFEFLQSTILYMDSDYGFHLIRKELFALPYFMPELYFYISYRVKCLFNSTLGFEILKQEIKQEVELLFGVIKEFCLIGAIDFFKKPINAPIYVAINALRGFIVEAETNKSNKGINLKLYAYATDSCLCDSDKSRKHLPPNLLFVLAFLLDQPYFASISFILSAIMDESPTFMIFIGWL